MDALEKRLARIEVKVRPEPYNRQGHKKCRDNRFKDYPEKHEVRSFRSDWSLV